MYTLVYILLIIFLIFIIIVKLNKSKIKGRIGESVCSSILSLLPKDKYIVVDDVLLKTSNGTSQIDHVVLSIYGIFVIETKNYSGWIYGGEYSDNWTKNVYGNKYSFYNPLKQNDGHIKAIKRYLKITNDNSVIGIVAFSNKASLKVTTGKNVVNFRGLLSCIKRYNTQYYDFTTIESFANKLRSNIDYSREEAKQHVTEVKEKTKTYDYKVRNGICPQCGGKLVARSGKYGRFYGCSNYPRCKFTKKI